MRGCNGNEGADRHGRPQQCQHDAPAHGHVVQPAVNQHARAAGERAGMAVDAVAVDVEPVVDEHGRRLQQEQRQIAEQIRRHRERNAQGRCQRPDRVGRPRHRIELQAQRGGPGGDAQAEPLRRRQRAVGQARTDRSRAGQPSLSLIGLGRDHRPEHDGARTADAAIAQGCASQCLPPRCTVDEAVDRLAACPSS